MADEIKVTITGKDGVSKVFQEVSKSADSMQKSLSKDAAAAGTSLNKMSQDAEKASASTTKSLEQTQQASKRASDEFKVAGAAIGASLSLFSRDIVTNQQNVATLTRTYGEAAGELQAFAQQIQQSTTYSSEAAIQSENIFGTLVRNYGLSVDQVKQLVQVSTDLAATSGLSLEDVSERVQSAIRGEGEAAEALGLTMNQQSIDRNNLTLTMTNQEAAQFRLNALMEQTSFAQGAAGDKAKTTAGQIAQLNNQFQDLARGALSAAGPLPQIVSGITNVGAETGFAITGVVSLAKGFKDLTSAAGGIKNVITASQGLSAAIGTAGVVGAIGLAAVAAVTLSDHMGSYAQSAEHANQASASLDTTIAGLSTTMTNASLAFDLTSMKQDLDIVDDQMERIRTLRDQMQSEQNTQQGMGTAEIDASNARIAAYKQEYDALVAIYGDAPESAVNQQVAALDALKAITTNTGAGAEQAIADAAKLHDEFANGQKTFAEYSAGLVAIAGSLTSYQSAALEVAAANQQTASSYIDVTKAITDYLGVDVAQSSKDTALAMRDSSVAVLDSISYFTQAKDAYYGLAGGADAYIAVQQDVLDILAATGPTADAAREALAILEQQHKTHQISADRFAEEVNVINENLQRQEADAALTAAANGNLATSFDAVEFGARKAAAGLIDMGESTDFADLGAKKLVETLGQLMENAGAVGTILGNAKLSIDDIAEIMGGYTTKQKEANASAHEASTTLKGEYANSLDDAETRTKKLTAALAEQRPNWAIQAIQAQDQALLDYAKQAADAAKAVGLLSTNAQLFQAAGIKTPALDVAVNLQGGQNAFDPVMGAIKQAQSMASNLGGAKSWADNLIGDRGVWSELDQLLTDSRIDIDQYRAAQDAQESITRDVTNATEDLNAVQAMLAPTLADAVHQQADYINGLQDLGPQQQLAALGYMDTAESAKAMSLAQLAAASTTDTMQASTGAMIEAAAAADPVLKAMLEDMGLLDAKTGHVNFDTNAVDVGTAVTELTTSIDALIIALGGIPPIHTESNAAKTMGDVDALSVSINNIPGDHNTNINATDNASGVIGGVSQALDNINGKTASTFLNNYVTTFTTAVTSVSPGTGTGGGGAPIGGSRNGGVIGFAGGGFVNAELAENGPELLRFRDGGETIVPRRGLYAVPVGASVLPAEATKATLRERGGGDVYIDMRGASITIEATDGDVAETWRSWAINQARTG